MFKALPILGAARVCVCVCVCIVFVHMCVWSRDYKQVVPRPSLSTGAWAPGLLVSWVQWALFTCGQDCVSWAHPLQSTETELQAAWRQPPDRGAGVKGP